MCRRDASDRSVSSSCPCHRTRGTNSQFSVQPTACIIVHMYLYVMHNRYAYVIFIRNVTNAQSAYTNSDSDITVIPKLKIKT